MSLAVVGLSHHSAPVEVRERFVFPRGAAAAALAGLRRSGVAEEAVLLSTCNRTEFYLRLPDGVAGEEAVVELLAERAGMSVAEASSYIYRHGGRRGVEHLYRVVSSLDSMVVGEAQIQGQVRAAYEHASGLDTTPRVVGPVLSRMFQSALAVGGRVRSMTALGSGAASIPSAAVELARKIFGSLRGRRALVLGAGEMSELALECLKGENVASIVVANRTLARAEELAHRVGGRAIPYDAFPAAIAEADIVVTATASPTPILTRRMLEEALPGGPRTPLLIVDIAIPRDAEGDVGAMENVFLYDIDDLHQIVGDNLQRRESEIPRAERIVAEAVDEFWSWYRSLDVVPLIRAMRDRAEEVRRLEVEKALRRLDHLGPDDRAAVEKLTRQILNKVLHQPTVRLREAASQGNGLAVVHAARYLFDTDDSEKLLDGEDT